MTAMHQTDDKQHNEHGSLRTYAIGFILSLVLTFAAYIPAAIHQNSHHEIFSHEFLIPLLLIFAFIQLGIQLIFFLHILSEKKPRWNSIFFVGTFGLVILVVGMSIWIMNHLNHNMMPQQMDNYIMQDEGIQK